MFVKLEVTLIFDRYGIGNKTVINLKIYRIFRPIVNEVRYWAY
ncbi:hypothetical protein B0O79_2257 [Flavobacteriaceae bacterium MAR_2009_75]|nr:hypothetical protein B0O79_2257 [Flavobacteriaceae bacterium MAR_2009_75]